jgi:anti-sigma regulatory factor (Ser/Thr protein kinase)
MSRNRKIMENLTVAGTLDSLDAIAKYVMAVAAATGLDKKTAYNLRLAVDEIATNIIIHGYEEAGREGVLDLQTFVDEQTLTISLKDTGVPYNPNQRLTPDDLDQPLEQRKIGGLGVYIAIQGVDKFIYERVGDRNHNIFIVNLSKKAITN